MLNKNQGMSMPQPGMEGMPGQASPLTGAPGIAGGGKNQGVSMPQPEMLGTGIAGGGFRPTPPPMQNPITTSPPGQLPVGPMGNPTMGAPTPGGNPQNRMMLANLLQKFNAPRQTVMPVRGGFR